MRRGNIARPIGIKVDGKPKSLQSYLLTEAERPVPNAPTHYVMVDVLNKDLSIKRVTVYFNPMDTWTNSDSRFFEENKPLWIGTLIGDNLGFLTLDPNIMAYTFWIVEIATNEIIYKGHNYNFCNYDNY